MKKTNYKNFILIAFLLISISCSSGSEISKENMNENHYNLSLLVKGSQSFNPNIVHGEIDYYLITISADDFKPSIQRKISGINSEATVLNIPTGSSRTVTIEAINKNGLIIRRGIKEGLHVEDGQITQAEMVMNTVPIFTNLRNGSAVSISRLQFDIFGEPGSKLQIIQIGADDQEHALVNQSNSSLFIDTSNSEGLFHMNTSSVSLGNSQFILKDLSNQEESRIIVSLYQEMHRPGLTLVSGGNVWRRDQELLLSNIGFSFYKSENPNHSLEALLLDQYQVILDMGVIQ